MREMLSLDLTKMGCCGREYIHASFAWSSIALQFSQTFNHMLNKLHEK
jgi:hypothetical protein